MLEGTGHCQQKEIRKWEEKHDVVRERQKNSLQDKTDRRLAEKDKLETSTRQDRRDVHQGKTNWRSAQDVYVCSTCTSLQVPKTSFQIYTEMSYYHTDDINYQYNFPLTPGVETGASSSDWLFIPQTARPIGSQFFFFSSNSLGSTISIG